MNNIMTALYILNVLLSVNADLRLRYKSMYFNILISVINPLATYWLFLNNVYKAEGGITQNVIVVILTILLWARTFVMYRLLCTKTKLSVIESFQRDLSEHLEIMNKFPNKLGKSEMQLIDNTGVLTGRDLLSVASVLNQSYFNVILDDEGKLIFLNYINEKQPYSKENSEFEIDELTFVTEDLVRATIKVNSLYNYRLLFNKFKFCCAILLEETTIIDKEYKTEGIIWDESKVTWK